MPLNAGWRAPIKTTAELPTTRTEPAGMIVDGERSLGSWRAGLTR